MKQSNVSAIKTVVSDAWSIMPGRIILVAVLTVTQGIIDGFAMALLFPLIALLGIGDSSEGEFVARINRALEQLHIEPNVSSILMLLVGTVILQNIVLLVHIRAVSSLTRELGGSLSKRLWQAYLMARWRFFVGRKLTDLMTAISQVDQVSQALVYMIQFAAMVVVTLIYIALALVAAWQVSALLIVMAVVSFALTRGILNRAKRASEAAFEAARDYSRICSETAAAMKLVKATGSARRTFGTMFPAMDLAAARQAGMVVYPTAIRATFEVIAIATISGMLYAATAYSAFDSATVIAVLVIFVRVYPRLTTLQQFLNGVVVNLPPVPIVYGTLREATNDAEPAADDVTRLCVPAGPVSLKISDLTVAYGQTTVLNALNLEIPKGASLGIVGSSGAGKTTLVDALLGLVEAESGRIEISGVPLEKVNLDEWRMRVGYVSQQTVIFNTSIRENIAWCTDHQDLAAIEKAAKLAYADEFIRAMPNGYETEPGDMGARMSGGQRQRIGLARALVGSKDLLILDEATSSLDADSEAYIQQSIASQKGFRTILVIAHRLTSVRDMDEIIVLNHGKIVERGTFAELVRTGGQFAKMWRLQSDQPDPHSARSDV